MWDGLSRKDSKRSSHCASVARKTRSAHAAAAAAAAAAATTMVWANRPSRVRKR